MAATTQTPNNKHPTPKQPQIPNPNPPRDLGRFELGTWSFSGVWSLAFGLFISLRASGFLRTVHHSSPSAPSLRIGKTCRLRISFVIRNSSFAPERRHNGRCEISTLAEAIRPGCCERLQGPHCRRWLCSTQLVPRTASVPRAARQRPGRRSVPLSDWPA